MSAPQVTEANREPIETQQEGLELSQQPINIGTGQINSQEAENISQEATATAETSEDLDLIESIRRLFPDTDNQSNFSSSHSDNTQESQKNLDSETKNPMKRKASDLDDLETSSSKRVKFDSTSGDLSQPTTSNTTEHGTATDTATREATTTVTEPNTDTREATTTATATNTATREATTTTTETNTAPATVAGTGTQSSLVDDYGDTSCEPMDIIDPD